MEAERTRSVASCFLATTQCHDSFDNRANGYTMKFVVKLRIVSTSVLYC